LTQIEKIVNMLGENEIYTLLDAHQDAGLRQYCGEGIPDFYGEGVQSDCNATKFGPQAAKTGYCYNFQDWKIPTGSDGLPDLKHCQDHDFGKYYISPQIMDVFDRLYTNYQGMQDQFVKHWDKVSAKFANNPYVVGYDLLNEPACGGVYDDLNKSAEGYQNQYQLQPMYMKVSDAIRKNDKNKIIMFEGAGGCNWFGEKNKYDGFTQTPGGELFKPQEIWNFHAYCSSDIGSAAYCKDQQKRNVANAMAFADKMKIGSIITEFGSCGNTEGCAQEITNMGDAADAQAMSYSYWMYKPFHDYTCFLNQPEGMWILENNEVKVQDIKVKALARTYVQKYQGKPLGSKFDTTTSKFEADFTIDLNLDEESIVFFSKDYYYQQGADINVNFKNADKNDFETQIRNIDDNHVGVKVKSVNKSQARFVDATITVTKKTESKNNKFLSIKTILQDN